MASRSFVQTQVFVGPLWEPGAATAWDWGRTADFALAGVSGSLTAPMTSLSASAQFSGLTPAPKGGLWVGPMGDGEAWEYVAYGAWASGVASGLRREPAALYEHSGAHGLGAPVRMWAPIGGADGKIHVLRESNEAMSAQKWSADLAGVLAPRDLLRRHHALLVRQRTVYNAAWTTLLLGWLDEYSVDDDYTRAARWKLRVVSSAGMLEKMAAPPLRSGELDLCRFGKIVVQDTPLAAVHKEWSSGDFVMAAPDVTARSAIDGDEETAWIGERVLGFTTDANGDDMSYGPGDEANFGECFVLEANLGIPPGLGKGYRWIQLATIDGGIGDVIICNKGGDVGGLIDIGGSAGPGSRIFIVENLNQFSAHNPLANPTRIKEVGSAFFDSFDMNNDGLAIWYAGLDGGGANWRGKALKWRNPNMTGLPGFTIRRSQSAEPDADPAPLMAGAYLPSPLQGEVYAWRRKTGTPAGTAWYDLTFADTAGYDPGKSKPYPFFLVQLPGMGLALKSGVTAGYTGFVELWDGKTAQTNGLPGSGVVQIGSEQMSYSARTATGIQVSARGVSGTAAAHEANDSVLLVENGQATDAFRIKAIRWRRRAGGSFPSHFKIYASGMAVQPRHPTNDDEDPNYEFQNDYEKLADVEWHASGEYALDLSAQPRRISWLLFSVSLMSERPCRPRIDSIEAALDTAYFDGSRWLPEGATVGDCFRRILSNAGAPADAVTISAQMPVSGPFEMMTAHGAAWAVLGDLADYTGAYISVDLLSRITVGTNPLWRLDMNQAPVRSWNRASLAAVHFIAERSTPTAQMQMPWLNPDGSLAELLTCPALPDPVGDVQEVKGAIYPSRSVALDALQRRYLIAKYPYTVGMELARGEDALAPGEINSVTWEFGDGTATRLGIVRDVEHTIDGMAWKTAARLVLYREAY